MERRARGDGAEVICFRAELFATRGEAHAVDQLVEEPGCERVAVTSCPAPDCWYVDALQRGRWSSSPQAIAPGSIGCFANPCPWGASLTAHQAC